MFHLCPIKSSCQAPGLRKNRRTSTNIEYTHQLFGCVFVQGSPIFCLDGGVPLVFLYNHKTWGGEGVPSTRRHTVFLHSRRGIKNLFGMKVTCFSIWQRFPCCTYYPHKLLVQLAGRFSEWISDLILLVLKRQFKPQYVSSSSVGIQNQHKTSNFWKWRNSYLRSPSGSLALFFFSFFFFFSLFRV